MILIERLEGIKDQELEEQIELLYSQVNRTFLQKRENVSNYKRTFSQFTKTVKRKYPDIAKGLLPDTFSSVAGRTTTLAGSSTLGSGGAGYGLVGAAVSIGTNQKEDIKKNNLE